MERRNAKRSWLADVALMSHCIIFVLPITILLTLWKKQTSPLVKPQLIAFSVI
jgi:hypothetical protein